MEDVGILWPFGLFHQNLVYFSAIWSILWPFGLFMAIWSILWPIGLFYGHLVYFTAVWYAVWYFGIFSRFGMLHQQKSSIPDNFGNIKFGPKKLPVFRHSLKNFPPFSPIFASVHLFA
jgi:hypothetical protein